MKTLQIALIVAVVAGIGNVASEAKAQNPVIGGGEHTDVYYDPFNDHTYVNRERVKVRESALDPDRMYVDPGSKRYVDRYFRDEYGRLVREYGWTWTSYGRPHGKLTRQRVTRYPGQRPGCGGRPGNGGGVTIDDRETVIFDAGNGSRPPRRNPRPQPGGVTIDDKQTVIFGIDNDRNKNRNNNSRNRNNNNRRQSRNSQKRSQPVMFGFAN